MFQFPGLPLIAEYANFIGVGCPIRKSADQRFFAPTRSLSQLSTSFVDSKSQGIHRMPLVTFVF